MRIDELKKEIELLGDGEKWSFRAIECGDYVNIQRLIGNTRQLIAWVKIKKIFIVNTDYRTFANLPEEIREKIFDILVKFARTPTDEREELKRYQYRLREKYLWIDKRLNLGNCYLNIQSFQDGSEQKVLDKRGNTDLFKAEFTDEEIKEVAEKFDVDLNMFDKIEVE